MYGAVLSPKILRGISLAEGMRHYRKIYKDTNVPQRFVVPATDQWPTQLHGEKLGNRLINARTFFHKGKLEPVKIVLLEAAGIVWYVGKGNGKRKKTLIGKRKEPPCHLHVILPTPQPFNNQADFLDGDK